MAREKKGGKKGKKKEKKGEKKLPNQNETKKIKVGEKTMFLKRSH